jgi:hypothetical protein
MCPHKSDSAARSICDTATITPECPIECLQTILSTRPFNRLARAYGAPFAPPRTVGEVIELHHQRQLTKIWGLGPRHIGEIEVSLLFLGLIVNPALGQR